jgi:hypothetical protein
VNGHALLVVMSIVAAWCTPAALATTLPPPQTPVAAGADLPRDVSGDDLVEDELLSDEIGDQEFSPDEDEVRTRNLSMLALGLGETFPWQSWSFEAGTSIGSGQISLFAGGGRFEEASLRRSTGSISIDAKTRSVGLAWRSWLPRAPILSGAVSLSWSSWNGSVTPIGVEEDGTTSAEGLLPGSFRLTGLTLGLAPGLSRSWSNGFWIEWVPVGIRRSWVLSTSWSRPSTADDAVTQWVKRFEVWGFVNLKVGWRF